MEALIRLHNMRRLGLSLHRALLVANNAVCLISGFDLRI